MGIIIWAGLGNYKMKSTRAVNDSLYGGTTVNFTTVRDISDKKYTRIAIFWS